MATVVMADGEIHGCGADTTRPYAKHFFEMLASCNVQDIGMKMAKLVAKQGS